MRVDPIDLKLALISYLLALAICIPISGWVAVKFCSSRRRHTRCSRDWSSDVCSSDLWPMWMTKTCTHRIRKDSLSRKVARIPRAGVDIGSDSVLCHAEYVHAPGPAGGG